jgi:hypothetical protein
VSFNPISTLAGFWTADPSVRATSDMWAAGFGCTRADPRTTGFWGLGTARGPLVTTGVAGLTTTVATARVFFWTTAPRPTADWPVTWTAATIGDADKVGSTYNPAPYTVLVVLVFARSTAAELVGRTALFVAWGQI